MTGWDRLRRRKVVQWGLAYVAVAWGLLQGLEFAVGAFDGSEAITRGAAVGAVFGLALVVTLAWFHGDRGQQRVTRTELAVIALIVLVGASATWQVNRTFKAPASGTAESSAEPGSRAADRRRLAVLPFVDLGADPANAAFVAGVHDTLITQIAKVPSLSVIARSSVLQYEGKSPTAREVAAALLVGSVLEGSVQRDGSRLRIQARLIDAATEANLWTETFDRTADDLFAIQSEIALAIVQQLRVRLTVGEKDQVSAVLTPNPRAYEHYVLGRSLFAQNQLQAAIQEFTAAVTLDPNFAAAYAYRSVARTMQGYHTRDDDGWRERGRSDADRALEIDPTLPRGHHARAVYLFRGRDDLEGAAREFEQAVAGLPGDSDVHLDFAFLRRWQGQFEEAAALFVRAAELDPLGFAPVLAARTLMGLGRHEEAWQVAWDAESANLSSGGATSVPALLAAWYDCNLAEAERLVELWESRHPELRPTLAGRRLLASMTGDAAAAVAALDDFTSRYPDRGPYFSVADGAHTQIQAGRVAEGRKLLQDDLARLLARFDLQTQPEDARASLYGLIALELALLGERAQAIEYAERAFRSLPPTGADYRRGEWLLTQAFALAQVGATGAATERLREMFALPVPPRGASGVWCEPLLRPLRADPRFRELIAAHGGDVTIDPHDRSTWPRAAAPDPRIQKR